MTAERSQQPALAHRSRVTMTTWAWLAALTGWTLLFAFYDLDGGAGFKMTDCWVSQTAREMLEADNWMVPVFSGEQRMQKSPGPYWAVMLGALARGGEVDAAAARLPSAILSVVLVLTTFWLARRIAGNRVAVFAGFATASSTLFLYWSHRAASDLGLAALTTLSLACLWVGMRCEPPGWRRCTFWLLGYFIAGLGMLYKLPMPLVCVGIPAYGYLLMHHPRVMIPCTFLGGVSAALLKSGVALWIVPLPMVLFLPYLGYFGTKVGKAVVGPLVCHLFGIVLFCLPWLPWAIGIMYTEDSVYLRWKVEFLDRFTGDLPSVEGQGGFWWTFYYLIPITVYTIPYTLSVPSAIVRAFRRADGVDNDGMRFLLIWFFGLLLFFTASTGKEERYFLPALPPLFIWLGCELSALFDPRRPFRAKAVRRATNAAWIFVPMGFIAGGLAVMYKWNQKAGLFQWHEVWPPFLVTAVIFSIGAAPSIWLYRSGRRNASFASLVGTMWAMWAWAWPMFMPIISSEAEMRDFADQLRNDLPVEYRDNLRHVGSVESRIVWYSDLNMPRVINAMKLLEMQKGDRSREREEQLVAEEMVRLLRESETVILVIPRPLYVKFMTEAPETLQERGEALPQTYLWLQTRKGAKKEQFVAFSNKPPPWPEPELAPPSETLLEAQRKKAE